MAIEKFLGWHKAAGNPRLEAPPGEIQARPAEGGLHAALDRLDRDATGLPMGHPDGRSGV